MGEINKIKSEAEKRRQSDEWKLDEYYNSSETILANTLYSYLKKENKIGDDVDVYNIAPIDNFYQMTRFIVLDADLDEAIFVVGDESDTKSSAEEYIGELIDDSGGYWAFKEGFLKNYIDKDYVIDYAKDYFSDDVYNNPDVYLNDSQRNLSKKQNEEISIIQYQIKLIQKEIVEIKENLNDKNKKFFLEKIDKYFEKINDYREEINEIELDPQGDFPDHLIDEVIRTQVAATKKDPINFINIYLEDSWRNADSPFIDKDKLIEGVIENDGYGMMNQYDGNVEEIYFRDEIIYIMQTQ